MPWSLEELLQLNYACDRRQADKNGINLLGHAGDLRLPWNLYSRHCEGFAPYGQQIRDVSSRLHKDSMYYYNRFPEERINTYPDLQILEACSRTGTPLIKRWQKYCRLGCPSIIEEGEANGTMFAGCGQGKMCRRDLLSPTLSILGKFKSSKGTMATTQARIVLRENFKAQIDGFPNTQSLRLQL